MADAAATMALVPEKRARAQRHHGGCVSSILFHLFDWHRRRRHSPKRLPPPPKKTPHVPFSSDDKMPIAKFLLIADDGFQGAKRPPDADAGAPRALRRPGMRPPGVVARLMGLEAMPEAQPSRERPRRAVDSACSEASSGSSRHDLNLEVAGKGRPQKLQRTGAAGECSVAGGRVGREAMQFGRSVVSRVRKQQRKLASPVRSPRLLSRRNSARLMEAAARILEPGLQQRQRARYALTYRGSLPADAESLEHSPGKKSGEGAGAFVGSCRSCGNLVEVGDLKKRHGEVDAADCGLGEDVSGRFLSGRFSDNVGKWKARLPSGEDPQVAEAVRGKAGRLIGPEETARRSIRLPNKQEELKGRVDLSEKVTVSQNQRTQVVEKASFRQDMCRRQLGRGDPCAPSMSKDTTKKKPPIPARPRVVQRPPERIKDRGEGVTWERREMAPRRRLSSGSQLEGSRVTRTNLPMQRTRKQYVVPPRGGGHACTSSGSKNHPRSSSSKQAVSCTVGKKDQNIASFTFNAPFTRTQEQRSSCSVDKKASLTSLPRGDASQDEGLVADSDVQGVPSMRISTLSGDALGSLLEQKIRELNSLHQMAVDGENVGRSTTLILEELISALTDGGASSYHQEPDKHEAGGSQTDNHQSYGSPGLSSKSGFHDCKEGVEVTFARVSSGVESDQPSPISILEASFSTGSSLSESMSSTSGHGLPPYGLAEESWGKSQLWDPDADFLDSATSGSSTRAGIMKISPLDSISIMYGSGGCFGSSKIKPTFAEEVVLKTELLLGPQNRDFNDTIESPLGALILDFVELLSAELSSRVERNSSFERNGIPDQPITQRLLFDCIVENLDLRYRRYWGSSFRYGKQQPSTLSSDEFINEIHTYLYKCKDIAGKALDEIIVSELKHPNEKWTEFEEESFETGLDIEHDLFQVLVDEMALDLLPR